MPTILVMGVAVAALSGCIRRSQPAASEPAEECCADQSPEALPTAVPATTADMVLVLPGELTMGDPGDVDSQPVHTVKITGAFLIDRYEVTQELYERVMGSNPSRHKNAKNPVERVRWLDAIKFCNARSQQENLTPCYDIKARTCNFAADGYRLPTEAEWECACRGGSAGGNTVPDAADKLEDLAWFQDNARRKPHPVGQMRPNPLGLYDMLGNVREWCNDWYQVDYYARSPAADPLGPAAGEKTVLRGGAFSSTVESCTPWARYCDEPGFTDACVASDDYGFRCVRKASSR